MIIADVLCRKHIASWCSPIYLRDRATLNVTERKILITLSVGEKVVEKKKICSMSKSVQTISEVSQRRSV